MENLKTRIAERNKLQYYLQNFIKPYYRYGAEVLRGNLESSNVSFCEVLKYLKEKRILLQQHAPNVNFDEVFYYYQFFLDNFKPSDRINVAYTIYATDDKLHWFDPKNMNVRLDFIDKNVAMLNSTPLSFNFPFEYRLTQEEYSNILNKTLSDVRGN